MEGFAALLEQLLLTPQRNARLALLTGWLADTPDPERGWGLAALTGGLTFRHANRNLAVRISCNVLSCHVPHAPPT